MQKIDYQILLLVLSFSTRVLGNETLIESTIIPASDNTKTYFTDISDTQGLSDTHSLFHIPGLTLTESNGPLGQQELKYKGLGGSRLNIDLEGLSLNNPLSGFHDANAMFLFAAQELQTSDQSLSISLPQVDKPFAKGVLGYGSFNSFKLGAIAATPLAKNSSVFAAHQFMSTGGRFSYESPDLNPIDKRIFYRENNDQQRYQAVIKFQHEAESKAAHILAAFNSHEGGFPGYAFSPTPNLRNRAIFGGLSAGLTQKINKAEFKFALSNNLFNFHSSDNSNNLEKFLSSTHEFKFSINNLALPDWLSLELGQLLILENAYDYKQYRLGGGFFLKRQMRFKGRLKPVLSAYFNMTGYADHGLLFKKDFNLSLQPSQNISLSIGFTRSQRLPTFMELYANNKFLANNENLKKESIWDFQAGSTMHFGDHTQLQLGAFWGFLTDLIVYEPFMAIKVRPKNIDSAKRYGLDLGINYQPTAWLLLESKNSLLRTTVKATGAPLPHSPWFLGLSRLRVGPKKHTLSLQARYKGPSNANDYGTKTTKGYILFDALVSSKVAKLTTLSLSATNLFNNKQARDTYEMPLPGTAFFAQIEVGNNS